MALLGTWGCGTLFGSNKGEVIWVQPPPTAPHLPVPLPAHARPALPVPLPMLPALVLLLCMLRCRSASRAPMRRMPGCPFSHCPRCACCAILLQIGKQIPYEADARVLLLTLPALCLLCTFCCRSASRARMRRTPGCRCWCGAPGCPGGCAYRTSSPTQTSCPPFWSSQVGFSALKGD